MSVEKITVGQRINAIFRGHPLLLVIMAGSISGCLILGYRNILRPYQEKKRRLKSIEYAEYLLKKEDSQNFPDDPYGNTS